MQSQFGWHVIQLDDMRVAKFPDYEQVKPNLRQRMQEAMFEKAVADLRAKAKIE